MHTSDWVTNSFAFIVQSEALERQQLESDWREGEKSTLEYKKGPPSWGKLSKSQILPEVSVCIFLTLVPMIWDIQRTSLGKPSHLKGPFKASKLMLVCTTCSEKEIQNIQICNKTKKMIWHTYISNTQAVSSQLCAFLDFCYISLEN